jgi:hypothetical protein
MYCRRSPGHDYTHWDAALSQETSRDTDRRSYRQDLGLRSKPCPSLRVRTFCNVFERALSHFPVLALGLGVGEELGAGEETAVGVDAGVG